MVGNQLLHTLGTFQEHLRFGVKIDRYLLKIHGDFYKDIANILRDLHKRKLLEFRSLVFGGVFTFQVTFILLFVRSFFQFCGSL